MQQGVELREADLRAIMHEAPAARRFFLERRSLVVGFAVAAFLASSASVLAAGLHPSTGGAGQVPRSQVAAVATPTSTPTPVATPTPLPVTLPDNTLSIPSLGISAPLIPNVGLSEEESSAALKNGVTHLMGTPLPGQTGMSAIAGHSSNYSWVRSAYNRIFAKLPSIKPGDLIEVNSAGVQYQYTVTNVYEVQPEQVSILGDHSATGIRLITCTPVGTSLRRLIVEAVQVAPAPAFNAPYQPTVDFTGTLPSDV